MPELSVVIPVRNEAPLLRDCLEALFKQGLSSSAYEVIVVDGHSTDLTREVAASFPVRLLMDGGVSVGEARNRGISAATGDVVAFVDADCEPSPDWARELLEPFSDPGVGGVGGALRMRRSGSFPSWFEDVSALSSYRGFITSNVAYRRDVLEAVGGFCPDLVCGEDWDLWWRVRDAGFRVVYAPEAVVTHGPPENASIVEYVKKQFWYGRSDVETHRRRLQDHFGLREPPRGRGVMETLQVLGPSTVDALAALAVGVGFFMPGAWGVASGLLVGRALPTFAGAVRQGVADVGDLPRLVGFAALKSVVRGAGALVGWAESLSSAPVPRDGPVSGLPDTAPAPIVPPPALESPWGIGALPLPVAEGTVSGA